MRCTKSESTEIPWCEPIKWSTQSWILASRQKPARRYILPTYVRGMYYYKKFYEKSQLPILPSICSQNFGYAPFP